LNDAHRLAYEIAKACKEIRKELLSTDRQGISLCDLRKALEAADSSSSYIDECHGRLLHVLRQARDAAGSCQPLLEALRAAQAKADDIANTKLAEFLQLALHDLNNWTQTPSHCQVVDSGDNEATSTSSTSNGSSPSFSSLHVASSGLHQDSQTACHSTPLRSTCSNNVDGRQSPVRLDICDISLHTDDDIDGPASVGDVINNNSVIVSNRSDMPPAYEQHSESASRMGDQVGTNTETDSTEVEKDTDVKS
jgi:hypothetical protein